MKRLMLTLSSLALLGVACGGRVLDRGDGTSGGSDDAPGEGDGTVSGTGTAGKPSAVGGKSTGSGGMVGSGKAGATGVGGKSVGLPTGGTFAIGGGDSGVGGAVIGWGGAGPDGTDACALYCTAYAKICPEAGVGTPDACTQECVASLQLDSAACAVGKRNAYECIGNAMLQAPGDCTKALLTAKQLCGSATPQVSACNASCVATSVYGGGADGCHATAECNDIEVDLHCEDEGGDVLCTCSMDRKPIWDIATGFASSKAGCIDDALFRLCAKELP